ncbi:hypothetical protein [Desulfogranum japonicum]|uniref:hypothetical protein n=1 Tax=Desulfogranum japonicum TaxID=231447 RepID=UPI0004132E28|nr:hypothetical protein [Desulfogranum japonicum]
MEYKTIAAEEKSPPPVKGANPAARYVCLSLRTYQNLPDLQKNSTPVTGKHRQTPANTGNHNTNCGHATNRTSPAVSTNIKTIRDPDYWLLVTAYYLPRP